MNGIIRNTLRSTAIRNLLSSATSTGIAKNQLRTLWKISSQQTELTAFASQNMLKHRHILCNCCNCRSAHTKAEKELVEFLAEEIVAEKKAQKLKTIPTDFDGFRVSLNGADVNLFKIVLIGDCGTGKTCFVQRFRFGTFNETHGSTIGVDFSMKTVLIDDKKVKLQIWDTAGQERFRTIRQSYYRSANGVIVVYDITKRSTFLSLQHWVEEVRRYTSSHVLLVLVGNRCDLEHLREVEKEEAEALRQYLPEVLQVVETSAKENTNIDFVFFYLASELKRRHENRQISTKEDEVVRLGAGRKLSSCSGCSYKIF